MKKIISIMAAGALLFSSVSAFAGWEFQELHGSNLNAFANTLLPTATSTIPSDSRLNAYSFDNNANGSMTIQAHDLGSGNYCFKLVSTEKNDYFKYTQTGNQHTRMSMDIMFKNYGGLDLKWKENKDNSYTTEKSIMTFDESGKVIVKQDANHSSKVDVSYDLNQWYNITLTYDRSVSTGGAPFILELRKDSKSGELINSWIGVSSSSSGTVSSGSSQVACFVTRGPVEFYLDNPQFGRMRDTKGTSETVDDDYNAPTPYSIAKFVTSDGKVVKDISSMKGKNVYAEFVVKDTDILSSVSPKLFIASYNANGKLQAVDMENVFIADAQVSKANINVPADAAEVKMFVWGLGSLTPIADPVVVNQ